MKRAPNQSTVSRILNGISVVMAVGCLICFLLNSRANGAAVQASRDHFELMTNADRFMDGSAYLTNEVRTYAANGNVAHYDNYWREINQLKNRDIGVENMRRIGITSEEEALITRMFSLSNELVPQEEKAMQLAAAGSMDKALELVYGAHYVDTVDTIRGAQEDFLQSIDMRSEQAINAALAKAGFYKLLMLVFLSGTVIIQILLVVFTQWKLIRPLIIIKDAMCRLARGDLSTALPLEPDNSEVGALVASILETQRNLSTYVADIAAQLRAMAAGDMTQEVPIEYIGDFLPIQQSLGAISMQMNRMLAEIRLSSKHVTSAAHQIEQAATNLASSTTEQSVTIEDFNLRISQVHEQAQANSQAAEQMLGNNRESRKLMNECVDAMQQMVRAMDAIRDDSENIKKIAKVVDNIAFQTNILALNAAVEAARAGEYGKGFAVVADEVRTLAQKSAEAAQETANLIRSSLQNVESGRVVVQKVDESLGAVNAISKANSAQIEEMDAVSRQQNEALLQMTNGIAQLSDVVHANSATAEQTAASSQNMSAQAQVMNGIVTRFHLRDEGFGASGGVQYGQGFAYVPALERVEDAY